MKSRYWVTLSFRLIGLVLIGVTIRPLVIDFATVLERTIREPVYIWSTVYLFLWADEVAVIALGLYLFLGGNWVVNRVFRGLEPNRCPKCGYDTHGLKLGAVCPECGAGVARAEEQ